MRKNYSSVHHYTATVVFPCRLLMFSMKLFLISFCTIRPLRKLGDNLLYCILSPIIPCSLGCKWRVPPGASTQVEQTLTRPHIARSPAHRQTNCEDPTSIDTSPYENTLLHHNPHAFYSLQQVCSLETAQTAPLLVLSGASSIS